MCLSVQSKTDKTRVAGRKLKGSEQENASRGGKEEREKDREGCCEQGGGGLFFFALGQGPLFLSLLSEPISLVTALFNVTVLVELKDIRAYCNQCSCIGPSAPQVPHTGPWACSLFPPLSCEKVHGGIGCHTVFITSPQQSCEATWPGWGGGTCCQMSLS